MHCLRPSSSRLLRALSTILAQNVLNPFFVPNYPDHSGRFSLLSTPERINASPAYTGRGVVMAFIDSGFFQHPDLGDRVLIHADASSGRIVEGRRFHRPEWYSWHGQMTSVIAAGDGRMSGRRYRGIACDARLVLIKVSNYRGRIKEADILRGLRWLIDNLRRFNVRVVNISVGGDQPSDDPDHPLHRAIRILTDAGITVLTAAGNTGTRRLVPPASAPHAITVGGIDDQNSLDRARWLPYHYNYGIAYDGTPKPEILAPAAWIASPILPGSSMEREARWLAQLLEVPPGDEEAVIRILRAAYGDLSIPRRLALHPDPSVYMMLQRRINAHKLVDAHHQHVDGTSVAVAIASSVVAQMLEANPRLTPPDIKTILTGTAQQLPTNPTGHPGVIDAERAVAAALS
jgi:serine protease AprX